MKQREIALLKLYDAIFVFSEADKHKLESELLDSAIYVSPFCVLDNSFQKIEHKYLDVHKLVFVGGESHTPNRDAIEWYVNEIADKIAESKRIKLHIIGSWSNETKNEYRDNSHIHFAGFVDNLVEYCRNSIMIVPVRIGGGIRSKILYAMAQGLPVISTSKGCEGIGANDKEEILIADTPHDFANAINLSFYQFGTHVSYSK